MEVFAEKEENELYEEFENELSDKVL